MHISASLHPLLNKKHCLVIPAQRAVMPALASKSVPVMLKELAEKLYQALPESNRKQKMSAYSILAHLNRHCKSAHVYHIKSGSYTAAGKELLQVLTNIHAILCKKYEWTSKSPYSTEQLALIAEKLCEEMGECTQGFHNRVNIVWSSLLVPQNFLERLFLVRMQIVQQVADTRTPQFCATRRSLEPHVHNQITRIAHKLGCGTAIENVHDPKVICTSRELDVIQTDLIRHFQEKYTPLLIIKELENQLRDQLAALGYENRKIATGYDTSVYNQWPEVIQTFFSQKTGADHDFLAWFITDQVLDTATDEVDYANLHVLDIHWPKIREAIYQKLVAEGFIKKSLYQQLHELSYNPENQEEEHYWLMSVASPGDLETYIAQNKSKYCADPDAYRDFLMRIAIGLTKEHECYGIVINKLLESAGNHLFFLVQAISNSDLLGDVLRTLSPAQWCTLHILEVFQYFFQEKNKLIFWQKFLQNIQSAPAETQTRMHRELADIQDVFLDELVTSSAYGEIVSVIDFCQKNNIPLSPTRWLQAMQLDGHRQRLMVNRLFVLPDTIQAKYFVQAVALLYQCNEEKLLWSEYIIRVLKEKPAYIKVLFEVIDATYAPNIRQEIFSTIQPNLLYAALEYAPETVPDILRALKKAGGDTFVQARMMAPCRQYGCNNVLHSFFVSTAALRPQSLDMLLKIMTQYLSESEQVKLFKNSFRWPDVYQKIAKPTLTQINTFLEWQTALGIPLSLEDSKYMHAFFHLDAASFQQRLQKNEDVEEKYLLLKLALKTCPLENIKQYMPLVLHYFPDQSEYTMKILRSIKENKQTYSFSDEDKRILNRTLSAEDWYAISEEGLIPSAMIKEKKEMIVQYIATIEDVPTRQNILKNALDETTNLGAFFGTQRGFYKCRKTAGTWKQLGKMQEAVNNAVLAAACKF